MNIIHTQSKKTYGFFKALFMRAVVVCLAVFFLAPSLADAATLSKPANNLGLVGYWSFDEGTGTVATDYSGTGNTGTLVSSPAWIDGKLGKALTFNGSTNYVTAGTGATLNLENNTKFTLSAWVKVPTNFSTGGIIVSKRTDSPATDWRGFELGVNTSGNLYFVAQYVCCGGTTYMYLTGGTNLKDGRWHHVTFVFDGQAGGTHASNVNFYVDTVAETKTVISDSLNNGSIINSAPFMIGAKAGFADLPFNGSIDEVRVYTRALSLTEVRALYGVGATKLRQGVSNNGLIGYWSFNDATSTKLTDFSGNGNTGTLTNMAAPATATSGWGSGKLGGGLNFDGVNDYVDLGPSLTVPENAPFSVSWWTKNTTDAGYYTGVRLKGSSGHEFLFAQGGTGLAGLSVYFGFRGYSDRSTASSAYNQAATLNRWVHRTVVFDGVSANSPLSWSYYQDGVLVSLGNFGTIGGISSQNILGVNDGSTGYFTGAMDELRVYNRMLSAAEVSALYASGAQKVNASRNITGTSLDSGLAGLWSFDGKDMGGTTAFDRSGNGNNGTLTNSPVPTIGKVGQALQFNDINTYVSVPDATSLNVTSTFSLSAWIYFTGNSANLETVFMKNNANSAYYGMYVTGNRAWFYNPSITLATNLNTVPNNTWVHVVVTFDSTLPSNNAKIYLNGAFDNAVTKTTAFGSSAGGSLSIGRDPVNGRYYGGKIDDVRIYNRALSADEVKLLYNMGK